MVLRYSDLKKQLFYLASIISIIGFGFDLFFFEDYRLEHYASGLIVVLVALAFILYKKNTISINFANALIIYLAYIHGIVGIGVKAMGTGLEQQMYQTALVYGLLIFYAGFVLKRPHIFIIGISFLVIYLSVSLASISVINYGDVTIAMLVILGYLLLTNRIIRVLNHEQSNQADLIDKLQRTNVLLKEQGTELESLNNTKDKLFSIIGHDLKTPANGVMGFADLISKEVEGQESATVKQYSKMIYQSANRLNILLSQLLDWSTIQTGQAVVHKEELNVNAIISEVIDLMHGTIYLKNIDIQASLNSNITIQADTQMLSTIIRNLLTNALKYTPKDGKIIITSFFENNHYKFSIRDSGVGMNQSTMDLIFSNKIINSIPGTENEVGTGLGISITREYVALHRGKLWVESKPGEGATFYFTIPE